LIEDNAMPAADTTKGEGAIWNRILESATPGFTPEVARGILALDFGQEDKSRMRELAAKAREGTLTAQQQVEIRTYERVGNLLALMKSRARRSLKASRSSNGPAR
jgi:uncharacterized protein (DUF2236 family)